MRIKLSQGTEVSSLLNDDYLIGVKSGQNVKIKWSEIKSVFSVSEGLGIDITSGSIGLKSSIKSDGTGNIYFKPQSAIPDAPADGFTLFANNSGALSWRRKNGADTFIRSFDSVLTANRVYTLQDASYKIAGVDVDNLFTAQQSFNGAVNLKNSSSGIYLFNTVDQTVNSEALRIYRSGNAYYISSTKGGSGLARDININVNVGGIVTVNNAGGTAGFVRLGRSEGTTQNNTFVGIAPGQGISPTAGFARALGVLPTVNIAETGSMSCLWIAPFIQSVGSNLSYLIDAGSTSAASGGGTYTRRFSVDTNGNVVISGNLNTSVYRLLDADGVTYKTAINSPVTNILQLGSGFTTAYLPTNIALPAKSGVDQAGDSYNIYAGAGTGIGAESYVQFYTSGRPASGSGATQQLLHRRLIVGTFPGDQAGGTAFLWVGEKTPAANNYNIGWVNNALELNAPNLSAVKIKLGGNSTVPESIMVTSLYNRLGSRSNAAVPSIIRGFGADGSYTQTGDLTQWKSFDGTAETLLSKIDKDGKAYFPEVYTRSMRLEAVAADTNISLNKNWHTWSFTGSVARVWTLPSATPENYYYNYFIKNRGSAILTIEGTIYSNSAVSSLDLAPGEGLILTCDGTYWIVISKN